MEIQSMKSSDGKWNKRLPHCKILVLLVIRAEKCSDRKQVIKMSENAEITISISPENIEKAEKIKEEANNCFKSMLIFLCWNN